MITKAQEKYAAKLVRESLNEALAEMYDYLVRAVLDGGKADRRMLVAMSKGVSDIADKYAIDLTSGEWGNMIEDAMKSAAAEVAGTASAAGMVADFYTVTKEDVEVALFKGYQSVKGILDESQTIVAEEMLASIVGGKSHREVFDSLAERLQVRDEDGEAGDIPAWRAELVARNELSANYRTTKQRASEEAGFKYYQMNGPDDDRTDGDVCSTYLGEIHTAEEWEEIGKKEGIDPNYPLLTWGFHVNCRHDWDAVPDLIAEREREEQDDDE